MEDGVFLPGYRTTNKRKKPAQTVKRNSSKNLKKPIKPSNYTASGTWVSGDPLTYNKTKRKNSSRKKTKGTRNLLPYVEQDNIYRKRKGNK